MIYLPSHTVLYKFATKPLNDDIPIVNKFVKLEKSTVALLLQDVKNMDRYCTVLYNGQVWSVNNNNVYTLNK